MDPPEHSLHITKAILMDLEANGFHCEEGLVANQPDAPRISGWLEFVGSNGADRGAGCRHGISFLWGLWLQRCYANLRRVLPEWTF